ncbi:MAG: DinB family protein [Verrucomicrobia bacterium]|nr:DinB family protein [Verrucomicrobiota bacterium]
MIAHSVRDNLAAIEQGLDLLTDISPAHYVQRAPLCFNSTAGGHLRHVIEHYLSFLQGLQTGEVDYEARSRDPLIESDPDYAAGQLEIIKRRLAAFAEANADRPLRVRVETAPSGAVAPWSASTALRELEFLLSHTVHHYALVAVVCRLAGQAVPPDFGMAPSTLRYLKTQTAACAR